MANILIADDHQMVREGLKRILIDHLPDTTFGEAGDVSETLALLCRKDWNLLLLDIFMPGGGGLEVLQQTVADYPALPILVISSAPPEQLALRALRAGASGYLNKQSAADELVVAVRKLLAGGKYTSPSLADQFLQEFTSPNKLSSKKLTDREYQVLQMIVGGRTLKEIAYELGLSPKTISTFRARIMEKLHLNNSVELIQYALEHRLADRAFVTRPPGQE